MSQTSFKQFLIERFVNAFSSDEKKKVADEVWAILQDSYKPMGGLKGGGFGSKEEMIAKIPFWKIVKKDGKVIAVCMYKDKNGRKSVAAGTDGSTAGKKALIQLVRDEFSRGYREVSGPMEKFAKRAFPDLFDAYKVPAEYVSDILGEPVEPDEDGYHYYRAIGDGHRERKIMVGVPGHKITPKSKK